MAEKIGRTLKDQLLGPFVVGKEVAEKLTANMNHPALQQNARELRKLLIQNILEQTHECKCAYLRVKRDKNNVTINWKFKEHVKNPEKYSVVALAREIDLVPDNNNLPGGLIVSSHGDGEVDLELEEGFSYHFHFNFASRENEGGEFDVLDVILFQIAIPLSDERKKLLRKAVSLDLNPDERIRHEVEMNLKKRDTFDEVCEKAVENIKAKKLSPKETKKRIQDFMEDIENLKDKFGM
jgi:hypothetical protein